MRGGSWSKAAFLYVLDLRRSSAVDRGSVLRLERINQMCLAHPDKNGYVMSYDEAYRLVEETYTVYLDVNENYFLRLIDNINFFNFWNTFFHDIHPNRKQNRYIVILRVHNLIEVLPFRNVI